MTSALLIKPSLTMRIGIGKMLGLLFGLVGFLTLPMLDANNEFSFRLGILFWYSTLGAIVGVFGIYSRHPVLNIPLPWWIRAPLIGGWMNFVLLLFVHETLRSILITFTSSTSKIFASPTWFIVEGAVIGLIIGACATKFGGEGPESAHH